MLAVACVFAGLAALVPVYILVLESVRWQDPATRKFFGTTEETAAVPDLSPLPLVLITADRSKARAAVVQALFPALALLALLLWAVLR